MLNDLWRVNRSLRWQIAVEAALAVALSIGVFTLTGRPQEGLVASMGAFCSLYFTRASLRIRMIAIPLVACGLVAAAMLGGLSAHSSAVNIGVVVGVAGVGAMLLQGFSAGPPAALMFVLVAGVSGHIVSTASTAARVAGLVGAGCTITCAVALSGALLRRYAPPLRPQSPLEYRWSLESQHLAVAARLMGAVLISGVLGSALGVDRPYWAMATAVAVLQGEAGKVPMLRAFHRVIGSLIGIGVFALALLVHPRGFMLGILIALFQGMGELLMAANYGLAMTCITPVALLIASGGNVSNGWPNAEARLVDTCAGAGAAVALCVVWVFPMRNKRIYPR